MHRLCLLVAFVWLCGGCAKPNPEAKFFGSWVGDPPALSKLQKDPKMAEYMDLFKDMYSMNLKEDHTYKIHCWALKEGKWKRDGRFIRFEETSSDSELPEGFSSLFGFDEDSKPGAHNYSGVVSANDKTITLVMGKLGDISFHR